MKQNSWKHLLVNDLFSCFPRQMAQVGSGEDLPDFPESGTGEIDLETLLMLPVFWLRDFEQGLVLFDIS